MPPPATRRARKSKRSWSPVSVAACTSSTDAKRESVGFTDSIFAEDIGKFPDTNLAESFNRIPGITITREISGEGLNIAIRGLGTNFTRVLLNDAPVAVASTGRTDAQNTNREVDLDMFPTELFSQLTVHKSSDAHTLEGGAAGTVNMRMARPFDQEGGRLAYSIQGIDNQRCRWHRRQGIARRQQNLGLFRRAGRRGRRAQQGEYDRLRDHRLDQPQSEHTSGTLSAPMRSAARSDACDGAMHATALAAATGPFRAPCPPTRATG